MKFVGEADRPDCQNLGVGVVTKVYEHRMYPLWVVFTGHNYGVDVWPLYYPCKFEELEKVE